MEAASVAWHPLGFNPIGFSEIEPFPCAILSTRYPQIPNYGSLTEYKQWPLEPGAIDLLVGGTPCQSFSVAGLRKGLDDPRGNLALVFLGLADKLKPRWIVWENVPGVLSSNGGRDLGSFLGALVQLGYGFAYRVLDAQHFGVPQRRRRIILVACLGDWRAPAEVLLESDCVRRDTSPRRKKEQAAPADAQGCANANHSEGCWWDGGQVSQTLDAVLHKGQTMPEKNRFPAVLQPVAFTPSSFAQYAEGIGTIRANGGDLGGGSEGLVVKPIAFDQSVATQMAVRKLTPLEAERLQGFPDNWSRIRWKGKPEEDCPDGPRYKACGNSMAVPVMRWIGERIAAADAKL
jgi:DNA (cytosine-5)-methyltransferase 1